MIAFRIDRRSGVATYLQLVHQVRQALRLGALEPGDRLPTAREVVAAIAINPNTVLRAYRELEREGLVEPRPGQGTFVRRSLSRAAAGADSPLRAEAVAWVARAREAGLEREDIEALTEAALDAEFQVSATGRAITPGAGRPATPGAGPAIPGTPATPAAPPPPARATRRSPQSMEEDT